MWTIWVRLEIGEKKEKRHQNLFACLSGALVSPLQLCSKSRALYIIYRQLDFAHGIHVHYKSQVYGTHFCDLTRRKFKADEEDALPHTQ